MDCAGAVAGPCCAKNGSNAGKTDRSLIALGNPACPNKFARRREGGGASFLVVCGDLKPPAHLVHEKERKRRRYDRATLAAGASRGDPAFQRGGHPAERRMPDLLLHIGQYLTGVGLIPAPIQLLDIAGKKKLIK